MKSLSGVFLCLALTGFAQQLTLDDDTPIAFGDRLSDLEARLKEKSFPVEPGRPDIDRQIATVAALLEFDSGRLWRVTFKPPHLFAHPLAPFPDVWKNFDPIGEHKLKPWITHAELDAYLEAWQKRAAAAGKRENEDFWIKRSGSATLGERLSITFAPRRRLVGTGQLTGDMWMLSFAGKTTAKYNRKVTTGDLRELSVSFDEFSTQKRAPEGSAEAERPVDTAAITPANGQPLAPEGQLGGKLTFDDGKVVAFGQTVSEAQQVLGASSQPMGPPLGRPGDKDLQIKLPTATLDFDSGRLSRITFKEEHRFVHPLRVFDEPWKNPDPIGDAALRPNMTRDDALAYLVAWKERATAAGKRENHDYWVSDRPDKFLDMISVTLAPKRYTRNRRGVWADTWSISFSRDYLAPDKRRPNQSVSLLVDAFNTMGRPPPGEPDPALAWGVMFEDGTRLYFGQSLAEAEKISGATATEIPSAPGFRPDIDRQMNFGGIVVFFDTGRLARITYHHSKMRGELAPFPEYWKNFPRIGERSVEPNMTSEEFTAYLEAWEKRAAAEGKIRDKQFHVRTLKSPRVETVFISMEPSRVSVGGGVTPDQWRVNFNPRGAEPYRTMRLVSVEAVRGEFNSRPPSAATTAKAEMKAAAKQVPLPKLELPKIELPTVPEK